MSGRIVIALGGNALGNTPSEQQEKIGTAAKALVGLIGQGYEIIVTHGNGPQVGMIKLAFEEASQKNTKIPLMPLPESCAMSQGYIGYHLQKGILSELRKKGMPWNVSTIITQVVVDKNDPAFENPTKPIGGYYSEAEAEKIMSENKNIVFADDSGKGMRRVVPSPLPIDIVEKESILNLLDNEFVVIACGGGGIPVIKEGENTFCGVDAVIDKDFASACLADITNAEYLLILTAVDRVALNYNSPDRVCLDKMSVAEAEEYCRQGHFAKGSMLPKVQAAIRFVKGGRNRHAFIASLENAPLAIKGESGTEIYN